jgi:hypothetical protein
MTIVLGELQLILRSTTKYFAEGSIIADSRELSKGLMVITSGQVGVELPMDSPEADEEHSKPDGSTLLYIFGRGCRNFNLIVCTLFIRSKENICHPQGFHWRWHCARRLSVGWSLWSAG